MSYFVIIPQSCGVLGSMSKMDHSSVPSEVTTLHCELQLIPSDDMISCGECYLVSEIIQNKLSSQTFSGYLVKECFITNSDQFHVLYPYQTERQFDYSWLVVNGVPFESDFGMHLGRLIISDRVKSILEQFRMGQCELTASETFAFDWEIRKAELIAKARARLRNR